MPKQLRPLILMSPGPMAGAEKVVLTGVKALEKINANPLMVVIKETRTPQCAEDFIAQLKETKVQYEVIESSCALDLALLLKLNELLKKYSDINVIHSHGFKALFANALTFSKVKKVHTHHGNTGHTLKVKIYETIAFWLMRLCQGVICVSKQMKLDLQKKIPGYSHFYICNNMLSFDKEKLPKEFIPLSHPIRLIYIGRLSPEKGILDFIEVFNRLKNKDQFTLTILGDGLQRNLVVEKLQTYQLKNVNYLGNVKDPSLYLKEADLLVMPSHTEGLPMTLIESLASSVPVLSNEVGAIAELVTTHFNGILIPFTENFNYDLWIQTLESIPKEIEILKQNAFRESSKVVLQFDQETWAKNTLSIYQKLF